jgi:glycerol-3-phosphate dehydrogenase
MKTLLPVRSTPERDLSFDELKSTTWDLLVVGGGITGTAVARDAALRGLKTALIEQGDISSGTSSRSSRLIHGGLRYLANLDFALVREGLVERRLLLDAAPGLVNPVRFLYPVYRGDPDPVWKVNLGVFLYEALALGYGLGGRKRFGRKRMARAIPSLRRDGLQGGVLYHDAATHDTRLTLAVALSADEAGALLLSRCRAQRLEEQEKGVVGAQVKNLLSGEEAPIEARATVLCCGPWQTLHATTPVRLQTARGSHISIRCRRVPLDCFVALRSPRDGRLAFAMPVEKYVVLGTTDEYDPRSPGEVRPTPEDTDYLLELVNHAFPAADVELGDVTGAWAGLRPLLADESGSEVDELSRRHLVAAGPPGLWILTGGKLTTHRRMAEDCLDTIAPFLVESGVAVGPCATKNRRLLDGSLDAGRHQLSELGLEPQEIEALAALYGDRLDRLSDLIARRPQPPTEAEAIAAQIDLAIEEEWALCLDDLLLRRIGPGPLDLRFCWRVAPRAARQMGARLGWSESEIEREIVELRRGIERDLSAAGAPPPQEEE